MFRRNIFAKVKYDKKKTKNFKSKIRLFDKTFFSNEIILPGILSAQIETFWPPFPMPAVINKKEVLAVTALSKVTKNKIKKAEIFRSWREVSYQNPERQTNNNNY